MIAATLLTLVLLQDPGEEFDHLKHRALFPSCTSCHVGAAPGSVRVSLWPEPAGCTACHDGTIERTVVWRPPSLPRRSNLRFDHQRHAAAVKGDAPTCAMFLRPAGAGTS